MKKLVLAFLALLASFQFGAMALAAPATPTPTDENDPVKNLEQTNLASKENPSLPAIIGTIIRVLISVLGIIMVILIVYAGFLWMTAGGDDDKVTQAKALIKNSVIGLILIMAAYAITGFVVKAIRNAADPITAAPVTITPVK